MYSYAFYSELIDPDARQESILHWACKLNSSRVAKMVFDLLFDEGMNEELRQRVSVSREAMISRVPEKREFVNMRNNNGATAMMFAAYRGNCDLIQFLVERGANPYIRDRNGQSILQAATQGDQVSCILYIIKNFDFNIND